MVKCRTCEAPIAVIVQGKAVIKCVNCHALNLVISQGSVRVDVIGQTAVASAT